MALRFIFAVACVISLARGGTLVEEAAKLGATTALDLLKQVGLDKTLETDYLTLFLPTNQAFADMSDNLSKTLASNESVLTGVLLFHATSGIFRAQDAVDDMLIESKLPASKIRVNTYDDANNAVFITLNGAKVLQADVLASNGIVHLIDRVMLPPLGNFYDLISMSDIHKTLKKLIDDAGFQQLIQTSKGTLFAPTDSAFEALFARVGRDNVDFAGLAGKESTLYHILPKVLYSSGAMNGTYTTYNMGEKLTVTISADGNSAMIDNMANVIVSDIPATNGVIHVIDKVLVPKAYRPDTIVG